MAEPSRWIDAAWRGESGLAGRLALALLWPVQKSLDLVTAIRRGLYRVGVLKSHRVGPVVVSIGNITVGGTGKTPVAALFARELHRRGRRVALALRGYGTDEIALHRRWNPDVPVYTDPRRVDAVRQAARDGADVVVLDDGFQHLAVARDLDVVLVSSEQWIRYGGHHTLPRGPYRERPSQLGRADLVLVTERVVGKETAREVVEALRSRAPNVARLVAHLTAGQWMTLDGQACAPPEGDVLAVAGIADPESFRVLLRQVLDTEPTLVTFPDHHSFSAAEIADMERRADGRILVTTEKDAVRLTGRESSTWRVLGLDVDIDDPEGQLGQALDDVTRAG